jgi:Asp-tRNA(Asn)/Glu-tRNA(Gln) amidotransferase C subunit
MWDNIFKDIKAMPPLAALPTGRGTARRRQPQTMTAKEHSAFDDMFNMIFNAASQQTPDENGKGPTKHDIFGKMRRHARKYKWTNETEVDYDRMKEKIDNIESDYHLLEWAMSQVFEESRAAHATARMAVENARQDRTIVIPPLQPLWYPRIVAELMVQFRDRWHDPHLALAIFDHASKLSVPSYVFGCTTQVYNELLATKWGHFKDVRGVVASLEEMRVNAVEPDNKTRKMVEQMRQDVTAGSAMHGQEADELMEQLSRAEALAANDGTWRGKRTDTRAANVGNTAMRKDSRKWTASREWKKQPQGGQGQDEDYQFNDWDEEEVRWQDKQNSRQRERQAEADAY